MDLHVDLFTLGHRHPSSRGVVSEILSGKRDLNVRQITQLAARFGVSPAVFMPTPKKSSKRPSSRRRTASRQPSIGISPQPQRLNMMNDLCHHLPHNRPSRPGAGLSSTPRALLTGISIRDIFACAYYHAETHQRLRASPSGRASFATTLVHDCA